MQSNCRLLHRRLQHCGVSAVVEKQEGMACADEGVIVRTWLAEWRQSSLHKGQGCLVHGHARNGPHQGHLQHGVLSLLCLSHISCSTGQST